MAHAADANREYRGRVAHGRFLPGLDLCRALYEEAVRPLLDDVFPGLPYAAARVGHGSEVLGFDTSRSADHEWGPRLDIFLEAPTADRYAEQIRRTLAERLPKEIRGWPTHFRETEDPYDPIGRMEPTEGPVNHRVRVHDVGGWLGELLGVDAWPGTLTAAGWLAIPQQRLAEATGGAVFHDAPGELTEARRRLAWYPDQVWRYLLACQWGRVSQQEAFVGRCAEVGDDLGSAVVAARIVRDLMRLCLLLGRRYAPYDKWLGTAFARLPLAGELTPILRGAVAATDHPSRERLLCDAYELIGEAQNATGLADPVDPTRRPYHGRPSLVLHAERFSRALHDTITDAQLRSMPLTGSVDQWASSTDLLHRPDVLRAAIDALGSLPRPRQGV
jgi:hypothetical protein